jgi:DNA polymerase III delta prime subunit
MIDMQTVSLAEAKQSILALGAEVPIFLCGEPGIGKTAMGQEVATELGYEFAPIDCATLELGDLGTPDQDKQNGCTNFLPNARFGIHKGKDIVMLLDEITKSPRPVMNMLMPTFNDRRLYDKYLTKPSVVFATGNLSTDGVGDNMPPHFISRIDFLYVQKPNAEEWCDWGRSNQMNPTLMAWVIKNPHCMQSYTDFKDKDINPKAPPNPYIYFPQLPRASFVCPRSLARASKVLDRRDVLTEKVVHANLAGVLGRSAAADIQAYSTVEKDLEDWAVIERDPMGVKVPENPIAICIQIQQAMMRADKNNLTAIVKYVKRLPRESQALFGTNLYKIKDKRDIAIRNTEFAKWAIDNHWMLPDVK